MNRPSNPASALLTLGLGVAALSSVVACQPCFSDDSCGSGNYCASGACTPVVRGTGGGGLGGGGNGGSTDGGVSTSDGGVVVSRNIALTSRPTSVTLSDNGSRVYAALESAAGVASVVVQPLDAADAGPPTTLTLTPDMPNPVCAPTVMVHRGTHLYTGCSASGLVRAYSSTNGTQEGTDSQVGSEIVMLDHVAMVVASSTDNAGGVAFTSPLTNPATVTAAPDAISSGRKGVAITETAGAVDGAATVNAQGGLVAFSFSAGTFNLSNAAVLLDFFPSLITSGRAASGGLQPVVAIAQDGTLKVYAGSDVRSASGGAVLNARRSYTGLSFRAGSPRLKVRRDGQYAYYFSADTTPPRVCRAQVQAGTQAPSCQALPQDCTPVDLAPPIGTGPLVVACTSGAAGTLVVLSGF